MMGDERFWLSPRPLSGILSGILSGKPTAVSQLFAATSRNRASQRSSARPGTMPMFGCLRRFFA